MIRRTKKAAGSFSLKFFDVKAAKVPWDLVFEKEVELVDEDAQPEVEYRTIPWDSGGYDLA